MVHIIPTELALNASGNLVGVAMLGNNLEDFAVLGPDIIAAANAAIGADRLRLLDALLAHLRLGLRDLHDSPVTHLRLTNLHHIDHLVQRIFRYTVEKAGFANHGLFHQGIAGTNSHAVPARNAS